MLVGLSGGRKGLNIIVTRMLTTKSGICAGKKTVANFLVEEYGFHLLSLSSNLSKSSTSPQSQQANRGSTVKRSYDLPFASTEALLDFVTKRWRERWVVANIEDEVTLEALLRRPFFILINVEAPLGERWRRYQRRSDICCKSVLYCL